MSGFEKAVHVRVSSLGDLVRLASTLASRMIVMPVYRVSRDGRTVYFLQMMYKDYYKYYGLPIVYYYVEEDASKSAEEAKYILAKSDETGEKIEISRKTRPGWLAIPLVNLEEVPSYLDEEVLLGRS